MSVCVSLIFIFITSERSSQALLPLVAVEWGWGVNVSVSLRTARFSHWCVCGSGAWHLHDSSLLSLSLTHWVNIWSGTRHVHEYLSLFNLGHYHKNYTYTCPFFAKTNDAVLFIVFFFVFPQFTAKGLVLSVRRNLPQTIDLMHYKKILQCVFNNLDTHIHLTYAYTHTYIHT